MMKRIRKTLIVVILSMALITGGFAVDGIEPAYAASTSVSAVTHNMISIAASPMLPSSVWSMQWGHQYVGSISWSPNHGTGTFTRTDLNPDTLYTVTIGIVFLDGTNADGSPRTSWFNRVLNIRTLPTPVAPPPTSTGASITEIQNALNAQTTALTNLINAARVAAEASTSTTNAQTTTLTNLTNAQTTTINNNTNTQLGAQTTILINQITTLRSDMNTQIQNATNTQSIEIATLQSQIAMQGATLTKTTPNQRATTSNNISMRLITNGMIEPQISFDNVTWQPAPTGTFMVPLTETRGLQSITVHIRDQFGNTKVLQDTVWRM